MFVLPDSTIVNKVIPKNAFDRYTNSKQKQQFTDKVGKIRWMNKLSPETIYLAGNNVKEIQVFLIELRQKDQIPELLKIINKAIPYHIIFILSFDNKEMISATEKHIHPTNEDIAVVDWTFTTDWFTSNSNIYKLNLKRSLDFVFADIVFQISGRTYSPELTISELISKEQKIKELTNRIEKLKTDIRNCRQFNRKVELNQELMQNLYILIEKYTTFHLKSIPLISANLLLWDLLSNTKRDDEYGYKTGNHETLFSGG